jgi:hypothetical protein
MTPRRWLAAVGVVLTIGGAAFSVGPPRLLLFNAGLLIEYPPSRGLATLVAVAGLGLVTAVLRRRALRLLAAVAAVGALFVALHLLLYRLEANDAGLVSRGVLGSTGIAWKDIVGLDRGGDLLILTGKGDREIRIDTTDFAPEQRASLQRSIARRVRESGGTLAPPRL